MKKADFGVAIYLLAAVIFFIIPIPSILLDGGRLIFLWQ